MLLLPWVSFMTLVVEALTWVFDVAFVVTAVVADIAEATTATAFVKGTIDFTALFALEDIVAAALCRCPCKTITFTNRTPISIEFTSMFLCMSLCTLL